MKPWLKSWLGNKATRKNVSAAGTNCHIATVKVRHLYISPGHNFFGHHQGPPGEHPLVECAEIRCVAGRGIAGDRFFDFKHNYKGQITFFSAEVFTELCGQLGVSGKSPGVARRNVITAGVDLNSLVGVEFEIQGVRFLGTAECSPCHWMDEAIAPGAEKLLHARGGLRANILNDGILRVDA
jgi:MOSC domain-containing protein YiiM